MNSQMCFTINTPTIVHETIDNEVVMIDFDTGNYYSLDKVGTEIWGHIVRGASVGAIVEALARRYDVSRSEIHDSVQRLVAELQAERLVMPDSTGAGATAIGSDPPAAAGVEASTSSFEAPVLHKYTDMQELLLLDPIHEVDETGWPSVRLDSLGEDQ
jgi:hypothetical protein